MIKRLLVLLCFSTILMAGGAPAVANAPNQFTDHSVNLFCGAPLVSDAGAARLSFASVSSQFGAFADVAFWEGLTQPSGDPTLATDFDAPATGTATDSFLSVTVPLLDVATGEPDGVATVEATLAPAGDPVPFEFRDRFGNHHFRGSGTSQPLSVVTGTLVIGGGSFALEGCAAEVVNLTEFDTEPNSFVFHDQSTHVFCDLSTDTTQVFLFADAFFDQAFTQLDIDPPPLSGGGEATLTSDTFSSTIQLFNTSTGEQVQDAVVAATVIPGEPVPVLLRNGAELHKGIVTPLAIDGTLSVPAIGQTFDLSSCSAQSIDLHIVETNPQGPKPTSKPPVNDTPAGAVALAPGEHVTAPTLGASELEEAPVSCAPIGRTLWYTVQGTGEPITIDTARSNFDTVLAVYTKDADTFSEVGCDDDIFIEDVHASLQAAITIDTVLGVTYYVQAGGFAGEFGTLQLSVS